MSQFEIELISSIRDLAVINIYVFIAIGLIFLIVCLKIKKSCGD